MFGRIAVYGYLVYVHTICYGGSIDLPGICSGLKRRVKNGRNKLASIPPQDANENMGLMWDNELDGRARARFVQSRLS
jgi:hypothetical protein